MHYKYLFLQILLNLEKLVFTAKRLASVGVDIMYFLSAFRAMNKAAEGVYLDIIANGSQANSIDKMQIRE